MSKSSNYKMGDYYSRIAREREIRCRSYFKLEQIDKKFKIIQKGLKILDLGCSPGGWMQYCLDKTEGSLHLWGVDLQEMNEFNRGEIFMQANLKEIDRAKLPKDINVVLSDLAPKTTGTVSMDANLSFELFTMAGEIARIVLQVGGIFVGKIFQGEEFFSLKKDLLQYFKTVSFLKPQSCRTRSKEIYCIARGFYG